MSESQDKIAPPTVTAVQGYGLGYSLYLHSTAWLLRKAVQQVSGNGATIDKFINVDTPGLGEGHVKVAICIPKGHNKEDSHSKPLPLLLVAEGGGFVLGQPTDGEHIIRPLSDDLGIVVVSVDYAKSPRYPYPHALLQLVQVLRWATSPDFEAALGVGIDASKVALMGNSAGGNLSTALSLLLSFTSGACAEVRKALPDSLQLVAQVLLYPSVACNKPYLDRYNAGEAVVRADSLPVWAATLMEASYLPPGIDTAQIFIAPLDADVELLRTLKPPPALCLTAGKDCLKYEANAYIDKLREAGVSVSTHEYPNAVHGFSHHKKDYEVERKDCWEKVSRLLRQKLES